MTDNVTTGHELDELQNQRLQKWIVEHSEAVHKATSACQ